LRAVEQLVPEEERRPERAARVARRGLDPDVSKGPSRRILPLPTQLSATPPARHRFFAARQLRARGARMRSITSSVTFWIDAARSISRCGELRLGRARRAAEERVELRLSSSGRRQ
jgi:hypothetical protein